MLLLPRVQVYGRCLCLLPQIRMQAQGNVIQGSMMGNFINIYQEEGTRGLWKVREIQKIFPLVSDLGLREFEVSLTQHFNTQIC